MSEKMTLVTVKANGQVLGAVTRAGDPDRELAPLDLAGNDGLIIRDPATGSILLPVKADHLKLETADRLDELFFRPLSYAVVAGVTLLQSPIPTSLTGFVDFLASKLTIEAPPPLQAGDKIWAQIGDSSPLTASAVSTGGGTAKVEFNLALPPGTYHLLALVPGYRAVLTTKTFS